LAISNFSELQDAIGNWLDRDDLDDRIPEFITLAEARFGRELRKVVTVAPLTIDSGQSQASLPEDCVELRSARHNSDTRKGHLVITTPLGLDRFRCLGAGLPQAAAVVNNTLLLDREADADYVLEIIYFTAVTPLSTTDTVNAELAAAPDLYLFGALCEAAPFLEHDERIVVWESKYQAALRSLNASRESAEYGAGPTEMTLPVVFG
jgi:hypothetical protein